MTYYSKKTLIVNLTARHAPMEAVCACSAVLLEHADSTRARSSPEGPDDELASQKAAWSRFGRVAADADANRLLAGGLAFCVKKLIAECPEVFGEANKPDQAAAEIAALTAERDKHFAELVSLWRDAEAALDRFGLRP
jgi:hypothetical protein